MGVRICVLLDWTVGMKAASVFEELEGRTVDGRFALLERLGGAADCGVFLTLRQGQKAVIKLIRAEGADADLCLLQWELAKTLSHPHLAQVFETGHFSLDSLGMVYVVTEYGDELLSQILEVRVLEERETREILEPVLDALSYLHEKGFVHGHLKPSNIVRAGGTVKLAGDNFISCGAVQKRLQSVGSYDAPEVLTGKVTPAVDTWSVGMTLAEMVTGSLPVWDRSSDIEPFVSEPVPRPYLDVVFASLRLDPRQRCRIRDMKAYLGVDTSVANEGGSAPASSTAKEPTTAGAGQVEAELAKAAETEPEPNPEPAPATPPLGGKWQEEDAGATPVLFSHLSKYQEEEPKGFRLMPVLLGALFLLAFGGSLLWRSGQLNPEWFEKIASVVTPSRQQAAQEDAPEATPSVEQSVPSQDSAPQAAQPSANAPTAETDAAGDDAQPEAAPLKSPDASPNTSEEAAAERDANGEVAQRVLPYPSRAAIDGTRMPVHVTVRVSVDRNGDVANAEYVSPGEGNYFARISKRAAQSWKFTPPMRKGRTLSSAWTLQFDFTRTNTQATATKQ
jgi:TonB family protein